MSDMKNLIDEYRNDAVFWEGQADQWRSLATALALDGFLPLDAEESVLWTVPKTTLELAANYILEPKQLKKGVKLSLTKVLFDDS